MLDKMAGAAARLSPDMLFALITYSPPLGRSGGPRMELGSELQARLTDEMLTGSFSSTTSSRIAARGTGWPRRFKPSFRSRRRAGHRAGRGRAGQPAPSGTIRSSRRCGRARSKMLMSYSDAKFVSEDYARELTTRADQAVDVEQIGDDPPARIRAWLSTVSDDGHPRARSAADPRSAQIEARADAWAGVLDIAVASIDQLVLVGDLRWRRSCSKRSSTIVEGPERRRSPAPPPPA